MPAALFTEEGVEGTYARDRRRIRSAAQGRVSDTEVVEQVLDGLRRYILW